MENPENSIASDINILAEFLSDAELKDIATAPGPVDCIVICASAIIQQAEKLFTVLENRPSLTKCLVLCGGIGHSTRFLYEAIRQHPRYSRVGDEIEGLPEARVLELILDKFFDRSAIEAQGCRILIEDQSTNCGLNAKLSRKVLNENGFQGMGSCVIIQDPTMMRRTRASFEKEYESALCSVVFTSCPIFTPEVQLDSSDSLSYTPLAASFDLWSMPRFLELLMGEIPRLRDDEEGYGPCGRGFINHVDIPPAVETSWSRLEKDLRTTRKM